MTTRMRAMVAVLVFSIASHASAAVAQVSIPFTTSPDGFITVPVSVGDATPAHVIFDTGAGLDVLAPSVIRRVHGRPTGMFTGFRMYGDKLDIPLFVIPELSVGPVVRKDAVVGTWDLLDSLHVDGIIAANDFRRQPFTFDFIDKVVVFETPNTLAKRRSAGTSRPIEMDDLRGLSLDLFARFQIGADSGLCSIDTGSPSATVNTRYMESLGIAKDGPGVRRRDTPTMTGVPVVKYWTNVPAIALAGHPDLALVHPRVAFSDIIYDCVVGIDFWAGKVLTLDIPDRQLIVARTPRAP